MNFWKSILRRSNSQSLQILYLTCKRLIIVFDLRKYRVSSSNTHPHNEIRTSNTYTHINCTVPTFPSMNSLHPEPQATEKLPFHTLCFSISMPLLKQLIYMARPSCLFHCAHILLILRRSILMHLPPWKFPWPPQTRVINEIPPSLELLKHFI